MTQSEHSGEHAANKMLLHLDRERTELAMSDAAIGSCATRSHRDLARLHGNCAAQARADATGRIQSEDETSTTSIVV